VNFAQLPKLLAKRKSPDLRSGAGVAKRAEMPKMRDHKWRFDFAVHPRVSSLRTHNRDITSANPVRRMTRIVADAIG
jgi:hypothetical protein